MSNWSNKWKNIFMWACGYLSIVAFALLGGYAIVKNDDEKLKATAKKVLIITLIFAAISAFLSIFYNIGSMSDTFYGSGAYDFYSKFSSIVNVAKIVVYAVFIIWEFFKKDNKAESTKE